LDWLDEAGRSLVLHLRSCSTLCKYFRHLSERSAGTSNSHCCQSKRYFHEAISHHTLFKTPVLNANVSPFTRSFETVLLPRSPTAASWIHSQAPSGKGGFSRTRENESSASSCTARALTIGARTENRHESSASSEFDEFVDLSVVVRWHGGTF